jgi:putative ABC transport system permease protein
VRLTVTLVGILFSIVLVAVQLGLYYGASKMITNNIDHSNADLWITIYGAKSFEDGGMLLTPRERHQALATPGVKAVIPLIVQFAEWRKPAGGSTRVVVVGTDAEDGGLQPWDLVDGNWQDIKAPEAVAVDKTYLSELGIDGIGDTAQIANGRVRVRALTEGIRSFTRSPYAYTTLNRARSLFGAPSDAATFYLVQLEPGANVEQVRDDIRSRVDGAEVLTTKEFRDRSLRQWLFRTGAGVGEFATLRALGSSSGYIHQVILAQAGISAVIGYALGISIALAILLFSRNTALPIVMTPGLALLLFTLTVAMCAISALSAIMKVTKIDPATVFSR